MAPGPWRYCGIVTTRVFVDRSLVHSRHVGTTVLLTYSTRALALLPLLGPRLSSSFAAFPVVVLSHRLSFSIQRPHGESSIELTSNGLYLPTIPHDNTRDGRLYYNRQHCTAARRRVPWWFRFHPPFRGINPHPTSHSIGCAHRRIPTHKASSITCYDCLIVAWYNEDRKSIRFIQWVQHLLTKSPGLLDMRRYFLFRRCWSLGNSRLSKH